MGEELNKEMFIRFSSFIFLFCSVDKGFGLMGDGGHWLCMASGFSFKLAIHFLLCSIVSFSLYFAVVGCPLPPAIYPIHLFLSRGRVGWLFTVRASASVVRKYVIERCRDPRDGKIRSEGRTKEGMKRCQECHHNNEKHDVA